MLHTLNRYTFILIVFLLSCNNQNEMQVNNSLSNTNVTTIQHTFSNTKMVYIPGGEYKPFYGSDSVLTKVAPYLLDERAVTNSEFLAFVKANPQWQRSNVKRIFADSTYLKDWQSDTELPKNANPDAPICYVSWFAAKAYAQSVAKRLPTLDEWEFMAMADETSPNARNKPSYSDDIISLYLIKERQYNAVKQTKPNYWGVYNVFDLIWEWTDDFNSILTTNDSRTGQYEDQSLFCAGSATSSTDVLNYAAFMRFALRTSVKANYTIANLGFRCAKDTIINKK
ncbi:MAG: formylglycine-generating enzyme family protein [Chitinophagaceae bacterium]|nr:formylglycine-generating enzyme family protein [Chitinophagaceae bacterium]MCW5905161.1 formylglycine-generating enzyme family protein [Chitinophagaceae bacterium]